MAWVSKSALTVKYVHSEIPSLHDIDISWQNCDCNELEVSQATILVRFFLGDQHIKNGLSKLSPTTEGDRIRLNLVAEMLAK